MCVVFNLSNNALEFLKSGETLEIECFDRGDGYVCIAVRDTGPGVPEDGYDNLFDAFVTHGKKSGTGLGLHIAKEIIEGHDGEIARTRATSKALDL